MELKQELRQILDQSKEKGFVPEADVKALLNEEELEDFDAISTIFKDEGVDIIPDDELVELDPSDEELELEDMPKKFDEIDEPLMSFESIVSNIRTDDPVKMYLMDIGKFPLLSSDDENKYARLVVKGKEASDKLNDLTITLSDKEIEKLEKDVEEAQYAKEMLVNSNLKLVVSIAKKYEGKGMQFLDLIQEGSIGLMKAVDKFEPDKGYKFSTYAHWWIRQAITRAVADQGRTIRIPVHMVETINKLLREQRKLVQDLSREPSVDELAERMHINPDKVQLILKIAQEPISLEKPVGEEDDSSLGDFVADPNGVDPYEYTSNELLKKELESVLNELQERERRVLKLRYGLDDGKYHTLEEVGAEFGITRERIRQIEAKALRRLQQPSKSKRLLGFIGKYDD